MKSVGKKIDELTPSFTVGEGEANLYYGMIRQGKSYGATVDIIEDLKKGWLVYATWPIKVEDIDDRDTFIISLFNFLLFKKKYYKIDCSKNFHYINAETGEVDGVRVFDPEKPSEYIGYLNKLNHCKLYIDEAWRVIDSYKGVQMGIQARNLILVTGHKFRTVNLIAQRPTSVHVSARGNMNRFFKFVKIVNFPRLGLVRFERREYQEMTNETVDETKEPISVKRYWAKKRYFNAYNSYYYGDLDPLHVLSYERYDLNFLERGRVLIANSILKLFLALMPKKVSSEPRKVRTGAIKLVKASTSAPRVDRTEAIHNTLPF